MKDEKLTQNFMLSEFGYVKPEETLLYILQHIRTASGNRVIITDGPRTPQKHIEIYEQLSEDGSLDTLENGQGDKSIYSLIPWGSRHLPCFTTTNLRAVDFTVFDKDNEHVPAQTIYNEYITGFLETYSLGIGIGSTFMHLDVDRTKTAIWKYGY